MTAIVELEHVAKRYGAITALHDVSFKLEPGETVIIGQHSGTWR